MAQFAMKNVENNKRFELAEEILVYKTFDYKSFVVNPLLNRRMKLESTNYEDMKSSIKEDGLYNPIIVKENQDGTFVIADGQHRFNALMELELPILFRIKNDVNISKMLSAESTRIAYEMSDFIGIGESRGYRPFEIVGEMYQENSRVNFSGVFETVFTYAVNDGNSYFHRSGFTKACKKDMEATLTKYNVSVDAQAEQKIIEILAHMREYAILLELENLTPCIAKQLLYHFTEGDIDGVGFDEVFDFFKKEKVREFSMINKLKNAKHIPETRAIFAEVAKIVRSKGSRSKKKAA